LRALHQAAAAGGGGNLQPVGTLLLELDASTSQFRLDDGDATTADRIQLIFDRKVLRSKDACLVGLTPDGSDPTDPDALVSLAGSPTDWGIDVGKFALGGRIAKGSGCGQLEAGEIVRMRINSLLLSDGVVQVEAKQNASAKVTLILDDGTAERVVGTRYLLSGRAGDSPPAEVVAACAPVPVGDCALVTEVLPRTDGGPDSGEQDDGFWVFDAPLHNVEVFQILANADGSEGKLSIKGGGEFPDPAQNRSRWVAFEIDGLLDCGDGFTCQGDDDCTSDGVTGNRTDVGTGDACASPIPFDLKFDGQQVTFSFLDASSQDPAFALDVRWQAEAAGRDPGAAPGAQFPLDPTILSYDAAGVACGSGSCSNDSTPCDSNRDCAPGSTCALPVTQSCIPLSLCVGTPIRRCADGSGCQEDVDCSDGSSCRLEDLVAPAGGFPDLVPGSTTLEYGCVCEEDVLYLGPGVCDDDSGDLKGASCGDDADCVSAAHPNASCVLFPDGDQITVEQCVFFVGDPAIRRGR